MRLTHLAGGEAAFIKQFEGMSDAFQRRLCDMGIAIGSELKLLSIINFGRLFYISVDDVEFCLRRKDAKKILVECL